MKKWFLTKKNVAVAGLLASLPMFAEGTGTNQLESLWTSLGIDFSDLMGDALSTLASPLVVVIGVGFVLAIVWACVRYGKGVFRPNSYR